MNEVFSEYWVGVFWKVQLTIEVLAILLISHIFIIIDCIYSNVIYGYRDDSIYKRE